MGKEKLAPFEAQDMGLRVFVGKAQAIVSTSDFNQAGIDELADRAVAMARWCRKIPLRPRRSRRLRESRPGGSRTALDPDGNRQRPSSPNWCAQPRRGTRRQR